VLFLETRGLPPWDELRNFDAKAGDDEGGEDQAGTRNQGLIGKNHPSSLVLVALSQHSRDVDHSPAGIHRLGTSGDTRTVAHESPLCSHP
jgi:hypothetical protein